MKTLTEYEIYLPSTDQDVLAPLRRDLVAHFGGLTDTRHVHEGTWRVGKTEIKDQILVWRILSERGAEGDRFMREVRQRLERDLAQEQVLVVRRAVEVL